MEIAVAALATSGAAGAVALILFPIVCGLALLLMGGAYPAVAAGGSRHTRDERRQVTGRRSDEDGGGGGGPSSACDMCEEMCSQCVAARMRGRSRERNNGGGDAPRQSPSHRESRTEGSWSPVRGWRTPPLTHESGARVGARLPVPLPSARALRTWLRN
jgi:hypothetical protein